ncbi:sugar kinase [Alkalicoccus halolimnae]|uniref:Sugar kinase n=1 Tax=Alkalicoccus halolimnae TaxID=1667239 RepID=A0A5C7FH73_9BACI|nr:sugar kinase [Alkalicoccus halolimnae]TXF85489.1 sugar kinase [Alkalicoccus halolimnae]
MILTIGEVLMRLSADEGSALAESDKLNIHIGGAEVNVAKGLSQMGVKTGIYSVVPDNDIGARALRDIRSAGVEEKWIFKDGDRLGLYFHEEGFSLKPPVVIYDRKDSSFYRLPENKVKPKELFEGVSALHVTGITLAINTEVREYVKWLIRQAKDEGVFVSFDMNYRSKLWSPSEAGAALKELLPYIDFLFAGEKDFRLLLQWDAPDLEHKEVLAYYYEKAKREFNIKGAASTNRIIHDQNHHSLTGYLFYESQLMESSKIDFQVKDRIGGGDGFASGILYGLHNGLAPEETLNRGMAVGVYQHFFKGDQINISENMIQTLSNPVPQDLLR